MSRRALLLGAWIATGCGGSYFGPETVMVPGSPMPIPYAQSAGVQLRSLERQAAREMSCPSVNVEHKPSSSVLRVVGCSIQAAYVRTMTPGLDARIAFLRLASSNGDEAELAGHDTLRALVRLTPQAARDLDCSPTDVMPDLVSLGHGTYVGVVEGCGRRVTYAPARVTEPFRLSSRVDATDLGAGFVPWNGWDE